MLPLFHPVPQDILKGMGPGACVLLQQLPDKHQILALRTWLGSIAEFYGASGEADLHEGWEFFLNWPAILGAEPPEGRCLGGIQLLRSDTDAVVGGAFPFSTEDLASFTQALGWRPASELSAWINCNRPRDHLTLAWLCSELATRFDGMIDLNGKLPVPNREQWRRLKLAGKLVEVTYSIDAGQSGKVHVADADFLRSWMLQPQFHMIK